MRARGLVVLAGAVVLVLTAGVVAALGFPRGNEPTPEKVAADYLTAWGDGSFPRMEKLIADAPANFADQHRSLSRGLGVTSIDLRPGRLVRTGPDQAHLDFTVSRELSGHGTWSFRSVLRLGKVDGRWRVKWSPATLYPGLKGVGSWRLRQIEVPPLTLTDRDGKALPEGGSLEPYVSELAERLDLSDDETDGASPWVIELQDGGGPVQRVKLFGGPKGKKIRTTVDRRVQEAAEKAVQDAGEAAIVALRPSTGEILAVADGLGGRNAFLGLYPPGSTFKVVTAAALLDDGMSADAGADCPATVVTAQRTIRNHDGTSVGRASLRDAFAQSCNTTFASLAVERLKADKLAAGARTFGFGEPVTPGVPASRGSFPKPGGGAELAEAAIGQGRVEASPLMMAMVAGAVADGTWRSPRMVATRLIRKTGDPVRPSHDVPDATALRAMMRAVVTGGTAAGAGLPPGTGGKTGTAEVGTGEPSHAWFIGFRGDLAFAAFVQGGGSGPKVAVPLAAAFLRQTD
ncbi:penicillin-binding transpeptidase domain-containing protein [Spirillospora sp. NPDC048911]|uniref:penicillin-binding transpeptidase domain-containing protein n=1 Tax=Spirillospora sp. NPDC048911 TaxID=3364527 RepID=UPI0037234D48